MKSPVRTPRHLTILLGLALTACGGDGNQPAGQSDIEGKDIVSNADVASQLQQRNQEHSTEFLSEKSIRGDVLIQALLSETNKRTTDDATDQEIGWLSPVDITTSNASGTKTETLNSPSMLLSQKIDPDTSEAPLGAYTYTLETGSGPLYGGASLHPHEGYQIVDSVTARLGLSAPGVQVPGNALAGINNNSLTIGNRLDLFFAKNPLHALDRGYETHLERLGSDREVSIKTDTLLPIRRVANESDTAHIQRWSADLNNSPYSASLYVQKTEAKGGFSLCLEMRYESQGTGRTVCNLWEVPDGWSAGMPLNHKGQTIRSGSTKERSGSSSVTRWSNESGRTHIAMESMSKTSEPINEFGISSAVMAAMFDAWTPRAGGMQVLPAYARAVYTPKENQTPADMETQQVSLSQISRATQYQDGAADPGTYSPATGSYLYAFRAGSNTSMVATPGFSQQTFAMHVNNDPAGTFTLPRWTGLHFKTADETGSQSWVYQDVQLSATNEQTQFAYTELVPFGQPVQIWHDTKEDDPKQHAHILLSVEKSRKEARTADLCWETAVQAQDKYKFCTLYTIPEGWQPGQRLIPDGYYTVRNNGERWSTIETPVN